MGLLSPPQGAPATETPQDRRAARAGWHCHDGRDRRGSGTGAANGADPMTETVTLPKFTLA